MAQGDAGETFTLELSAPAGGTKLGTPDSATITITEPAPPVVLDTPIIVDLNKDGTNDILLRNQSDGKWRWFEIDGLAINSNAFAGCGPTRTGRWPPWSTSTETATTNC